MKSFEENFNDVFKPNTIEELETIARAKADAHEGKEPQSDDPLYLSEYGLFKSCQIIGEAK